MAQIFNPIYKEVVEKVAQYSLSPLDKAALVLQELSEIEDDDEEYNEIDYGTLAKATIESFLGKEITGSDYEPR